MFKLTMKRSCQGFAAALLLAAAGAAQAQWMWIDAKGLKQVSDRPPPASIPAKNILKAPSKAMLEEPAAAAPAAPESDGQPSAAAAAPGDKAAPKGASWSDREAEYKKRKAEQAVADKKTAEQTASTDQKALACKMAQANKARLDSGVRIRTGPGRGEFMSDQQRSDNIAASAKAIAELCN